MLGFIGGVGQINKDRFYVSTEEYCLRTEYKQCIIDYGNIFIQQKTLNKFCNDKIVYTDENTTIIIEGVIYNLAQLKKQFSVDDNTGLVYSLYMKYGDDLISHFNGNFSMAIVNHNNMDVSLFTNHTSYKPIYYYYNKESLFFSTDINWLIKTLQAHQLLLTLDHDGAVCLLTHGYMLADTTLIQQIKKVLPGNYIVFKKGLEPDLHTYIDYSTIIESDLPYESLLEIANEKFTNAVKLIYEKDNEYNYKHLCTLSGGLDSRSVAFVANSLGYKQFFVTIGETGCLDETVSNQIANSMNSEHIFLHLDGGDLLLQPEKCVISNGGTITCPGFLHLYSLFEKLNFDSFGAVHTGEVGDLLFGGSKNEYAGKSVNILDGAFSHFHDDEKYYSESFKNRILKMYNDSYMFITLNRGLNSACNGWFASYYYSESSSAFLDKDFLLFILSVPSKYKKDSKFYIDWMRKYQTNACDYIWTSTRTKPTANHISKFIVKLYKVFRTKVLKKQLSMNPYAYWRKINPEIDRMITSIIEKNISKLDTIDKSLYELALTIKDRNEVNQVFMLCTLLKSIELFDLI